MHIYIFKECLITLEMFGNTILQKHHSGELSLPAVCFSRYRTSDNAMLPSLQAERFQITCWIWAVKLLKGMRCKKSFKCTIEIPQNEISLHVCLVVKRIPLYSNIEMDCNRHFDKTFYAGIKSKRMPFPPLSIASTVTKLSS